MGITDLQVTDDAVRFLPPHATRRRGLQVLLAADQQVSSRWVTAAVGTAVALVRLLASSGGQDWKYKNKGGGEGN